MEALRTALRRMTGVDTAQYTIAGHTYWSDTDLEGLLAEHVSARPLQEPVRLVTTLEEGQSVRKHGAVSIAGALDVESAEIIAAGTGVAIEATIHGDGRVEFGEDQRSTRPLLTGTAYDLNIAAAEVLTAWAAAVVDGYDVTLDGQSMKRSQRHSQLLRQAESFRSRGVLTSVQMTRSDVRPSR